MLNVGWQQRHKNVPVRALKSHVYVHTVDRFDRVLIGIAGAATWRKTFPVVMTAGVK